MRRIVHVARAGATSLIVACSLASTVQAVAVSSLNTNVTLVAPANDPGWSNVAHLSDATAVYLGNRWMITADHVADSAVTFSDGRVFNITVGSDVTLSNPTSSGLTGSADLRMFQLTADPGLPALNIGASAPSSGAKVTMIGAGRDRAANEIGWQVTSGTNGDVWTPAALPVTNARGFSLLSTSHMRWGLSSVSGQPLGINNTVVFSTLFSSAAGPVQAQAVPGDSGGGVFQSVAGSWNLVGIIDAQEFALPNQPSGTVVFGQLSYSSDLAYYRDQILSLRNQATPLWQNQLNHYDVNRDGHVTAADVLLMIDDLQIGKIHTLAGAPGATNPFLDVNGDGVFDQSDLALEQLALSQGLGSVRALSSPNMVPEPSSVVLALSGLVVIGVARRLTNARRKRAGNK
jgi:hypothetical protein